MPLDPNDPKFILVQLGKDITQLQMDAKSATMTDKMASKAHKKKMDEILAETARYREECE